MLTDEQIILMGQLTEANEELQELNVVVDDEIEDYQQEIDEWTTQIKDTQKEIARLQKKKQGSDKERKKIEARITALQNQLTTSFGAVPKDLSKSPLSLKQKIGRKFR